MMFGNRKLSEDINAAQKTERTAGGRNTNNFYLDTQASSNYM